MNTIRKLSTHELACIQPLFDRVFGTPISIGLLHWKYSENHGESWIAAASDGSIAVHCGLLFRDVLLQGKPYRAVQLVDLIAAAKDAGLSRCGSPFALLMQTILGNLPRSDNPSGIAFGFPSDRAMRLGEHLGVYRPVDHLCELKFLPKSGRRFFSRTLTLSNFGPSEVAIANRLWSTMANDLRDSCVGIRDAGYLQRRYLDYPERRYVLLCIESRWIRKTIGLVAVRQGEGDCELLDIVSALADIPEIIAAMKVWLLGTSGTVLRLSLTERFATRFIGLADSYEKTEFRIMGNPYTPTAVSANIDRNWWLTGGDTDYR